MSFLQILGLIFIAIGVGIIADGLNGLRLGESIVPALVAGAIMLIFGGLGLIYGN